VSMRQEQSSELAKFCTFVKDLPVIPPDEVYAQLGALGYRGQDAARQALALMSYRHVRRIKRLYQEGKNRADLMPKGNYLCCGPTGCGKTHMVELLFKGILKLPTVIVDMTNYSETGYVGQDTNQILTSLLHASDNNPLLASIGIICMDEFDKLAAGNNNGVFGGSGTTKDITGVGVQRELLKLLESSDVSVPLEMSKSSLQEHVMISTMDISFIACGAFSGFHQLVARHQTASGRVGFGREPMAPQDEAIATSFQQSEVDNVANFQTYGFLPELIGRFTRIVPFTSLDHATLKAILHDSVVRRMIQEFQDEGMDLTIEDPVIDQIVTEALKRETGARGLTASLTRHVEKAAFQAFGHGYSSRIRVTLENGLPRVVYDL
jgi:ATP-dependent Clp protease ATP-binding subunit ClpX